MCELLFVCVVFLSEFEKSWQVSWGKKQVDWEVKQGEQKRNKRNSNEVNLLTAAAAAAHFGLTKQKKNQSKWAADTHTLLLICTCVSQLNCFLLSHTPVNFTCSLSVGVFSCLRKRALSSNSSAIRIRTIDFFCEMLLVFLFYAAARLSLCFLLPASSRKEQKRRSVKEKRRRVFSAKRSIGEYRWSNGSIGGCVTQAQQQQQNSFRVCYFCFFFLHPKVSLSFGAFLARLYCACVWV